MFGDLDGDGRDEAALSVVCANGGGTAGGQLAFSAVIFKAVGRSFRVIGIVTPPQRRRLRRLVRPPRRRLLPVGIGEDERDVRARPAPPDAYHDSREALTQLESAATHFVTPS